MATAATFSAVAYPEMRRYSYPQSFSTGVIAAGGTLGAMFPPSTVFAVYGIITEQDIGKLFIAGIIPGLLAMTMYMITIRSSGWCGRASCRPARTSSWRERFGALREIWAPLLLVRVRHRRPLRRPLHAHRGRRHRRKRRIPDRRARGRLDKDDIRRSLLQATRTAAAVFTVLIGALIFGYFLTMTRRRKR